MLNKTLLGVTAISIAAFAGWNALRDGDAASPQAEVAVADRLWIDHIPTDERDIVQVFVAISEEAHGAFVANSAWKGSFEAFRYETDGVEIRVVYGQTGEREKVNGRATACDRGGMDYCLELEGASRGVARYYSREGWEIDGAASTHDVRARIDAMLGSLRD